MLGDLAKKEPRLQPFGNRLNGPTNDARKSLVSRFV